MTSSEENPTLQLFDSCVHCITFFISVVPARNL